jgi:hypothetical protein
VMGVLVGRGNERRTCERVVSDGVCSVFPGSLAVKDDGGCCCGGEEGGSTTSQMNTTLQISYSWCAETCLTQTDLDCRFIFQLLNLSYAVMYT